MTTLLTGATGFLGSHVARLLVARGDRTRALVRPSSNLRAIDSLPLERVLGDLRDPASLRRALDGVRRVFHIAADYRLDVRDPREMYESNVVGTRNLLEAARSAGVAQFIYTSTVATIAVHRPNLLPNEETPTSLQEMIGHYKRSKYMAEQEALRFAAEGFPVIIVNPSTPVGPGDWKPTPSGRILLDFLNRRMPGYVDTGLNWVPVEDCAAGHLLAAGRGRPGQRYILGAANLTLKELLDMLSSLTGIPAPRFRFPHAVALVAGYFDRGVSRLLGRTPQIPVEGVRMSRHRMFVDCSKAGRELGFRPGPIDAALERAIRWYEENGYVRDGRASSGTAVRARAA